MDFKEILNMVLEFISNYHLWIILGLSLLLLFTVILFSIIKHKWKKNYSAMTSSYVTTNTLNKELKENIRSLEKVCSELGDEKQEIISEKQQLALEKDEILTAYEDTVKSLDAVHYDLDNNKKVLEETENKLKDAHNDIHALLNEKEVIISEKVVLRDEKENLESLLAISNKQNLDLTHTISKLKEKAEADSKVIDTLSGRVESLEFDLKVAKEDIEYHRNNNIALVKSIKEVTAASQPVDTKVVTKKEKANDKLASLTRAELIKMIERHPNVEGMSYKRLNKDKLIEMVKYLNKKK